MENKKIDIQSILEGIKKDIGFNNLANVDDNILFYSFSEIYKEQKLKDENPLYEAFALQTFALNGIYGIDSSVVSQISEEFGIFKTVLVLDELLARSKPYRKFSELYFAYKAEQNSIGNVVEHFLDKIENKLNTLDMDKLTNLFDEFQAEAVKIDETINK